MRDTLDLDELRDYLAQEKQAQQWAWVIAIVMAAPFIVVGSLLFLLIIWIFADDLEALLAFGSILVGFVTLSFVNHVRLTLNRYRRQNYHLRILEETRLMPTTAHLLKRIWVVSTSLRAYVVGTTFGMALAAVSLALGISLLWVFAFYFLWLVLNVLLRVVLLWGWVGRALRRSNWEIALKRLRVTIRLFPRVNELKGLESALMIHLGGMQDALSRYQTKMQKSEAQLNLEWLAVLFNDWGYFHGLLGQTEVGVRFVETAIRMRPDYGTLYDSLAQCYVEKGIYADRAVDLCERALEFSPNTPTIGRAAHLATFARALAQLGDLKAAKLTCDDVLELLSLKAVQMEKLGLGGVYRQLGQVAVLLGEWEAAEAHFQQALEVCPQGLYGELAQRDLQQLKAYRLAQG